MNFICKLITNHIKFFTLISCCLITCNTRGIDPAINAKYPFVLINDDHGILTEAELADESYGKTLESFSDTTSDTHWKCYRTDGVTINYMIMEYSKEWGEDIANFTIHAIDDNGVINRYGMRRGLGITSCKDTSEIWKKLMENQEYVCINGDHLSENSKLCKGDQVIGWVFNKLKTKNGCDNYFASRDCTGKAIVLR